MSRYDFPGQQAAAAAHDSACDCCDHGRRPTGPDDADLYADGWTPGSTKFPAMNAQTVRGSDDDYWGINE